MPFLLFKLDYIAIQVRKVNCERGYVEGSNEALSRKKHMESPWNRLGVADQTKIVINDMITYYAFIGSN